jgi:hypothetical protein
MLPNFCKRELLLQETIQGQILLTSGVVQQSFPSLRRRRSLVAVQHQPRPATYPPLLAGPLQAGQGDERRPAWSSHQRKNSSIA